MFLEPKITFSGKRASVLVLFDHLKNIFTSRKMLKEAVTEKISATVSVGKNYQKQFYSLDAIIAMVYHYQAIESEELINEVTRRGSLNRAIVVNVLYISGTGSARRACLSPSVTKNHIFSMFLRLKITFSACF